MAIIETSGIGVVRLKNRPQFLFVRSGVSERRKALVVQARRKAGSAAIGAGFTATKKIGNAVIRNRAENAKAKYHSLKGDYERYQRKMAKMTFEELQAEQERLKGEFDKEKRRRKQRLRR